MKSFKSLLARSKSVSQQSGNSFENAPTDSPEANAQRSIRLFCESGSNSNGGEEVLHLPVIVESAESSPVAASAAAQQIRKFLGKEWHSKPHVQYNAIMLVRILSDHPGPTFTRNFDKTFVSAVKELLRTGKDQSTQQILRETLDALEAGRQSDEGVQGLLQMWRKEKGQGASLSNQRGYQVPPPGWQQANMFGQQSRHPGGDSRRQRDNTGLPSAAELASRVEEARNTAKILLQLVQSTPAEEVLSNDLIKEFSERCQQAQKSMTGYINAENPAPDHDTMQTLIETNEQLSLAMSRYQRAVLAARRAMGVSPSPQPTPQQQGNEYGAFAPPSGPPPQQQAPQQVYTNAPANVNGFQAYQAPSGPPPNQRPTQFQQHQEPQNPFADPDDTRQPPLAIEPTNYGAFQPPSAQHPPPQPQQTFHIEQEPSFAPPQRQSTNDLENAYSQQGTNTSYSTVSPLENRGSIPSEGVVSPSSPQRPGLGAGPWHQSEITQTYVGRQASAANGMTMHGAGAPQ